MTFYFGDCRIVIILLWGPQIRFDHRDRFHVLELGCQKIKGYGVYILQLKL